VRRFHFGAAVAAAVLVLPLAAGAGGPATDGARTAGVDTGSALVELNGAPLATYEKTKPAPGKKIDFASKSTKSYRAQLSAFRNEFKQWLRTNAPKAKVTGEFDIALNAVGVELNGESLATIRSAPMVLSADYEALYTPAGHDDPDLRLVSAFQAWNAGGGTSTAKGGGVKVAIVDTGIDISHPCFSDGNPANDGPFTNDKVIVAKVFNNKAGVKGFTPEDVNGHGTHVAGTVACNEHTDAVLDGVVIGYDPSGVAPAATLGNYNVFPGDDANARSEDIVDALEEAYADGFDVANMSLGGSSSGVNDLLAMAVDNLDQANMVIAVAAGNSGPGFSTIESPGKAARALTAGASTVGHFIGTPVTVGALSVAAAAGDFATVTGAPLTAPLGVVLSGTTLSNACTPVTTNLTGKIALISRGVCTFSAKIRNAEAAGAVATLVVNNVAGDPVAMAQDGTANQPTKPAYMVSLADRTALIAANGASTTISPTKAYLQTANNDIRAGFSSEGPTDVDFRVKPDLMAPGVNVLSSQPAHACAVPPCWAFFQGTSMATPHLAGAAAVVRGQHPTWSAAQVRSAIVNTADQGVIKSHIDGTTIVNDVNIVGSGRLNVFSAVGASVALDPVSVSFGAVPSGSGQSATRTVSLSSLGGAATSVAVTGTTGTGVTYGASLSGNTINVTMVAAKGASAGGHQAILRVFSGGTEIAHAAVFTLIK
jgi:minor extracellular serine protease Vpr